MERLARYSEKTPGAPRCSTARSPLWSPWTNNRRPWWPRRRTSRASRSSSLWRPQRSRRHLRRSQSVGSSHLVPSSSVAWTVRGCLNAIAEALHAGCTDRMRWSGPRRGHRRALRSVPDETRGQVDLLSCSARSRCATRPPRRREAAGHVPGPVSRRRSWLELRRTWCARPVRRGGPPYWTARRGHRRARVVRRAAPIVRGVLRPTDAAPIRSEREADALLAFDRPVAPLRRLETQGCEIDAVADRGEHLTTKTRGEELGSLRRPVRHERDLVQR